MLDLGAWEAIATIMATLVAAVAMGGTYMGWRKSELRRDDVLAWANECLDALQSLALILSLPPTLMSVEAGSARLLDVVFKTSILIGRGRLFFKNQKKDGFGSDKSEAFRGYRPAILDPLVVAHKIALAWPTADAERRILMNNAADDCVRSFITLAQKEVGRSRSASVAASKSGESSNLTMILAIIEGKRLPLTGLSPMEILAGSGSESYNVTQPSDVGGPSSDR